jgi:hypothetical protein
MCRVFILLGVPALACQPTKLLQAKKFGELMSFLSLADESAYTLRSRDGASQGLCTIHKLIFFIFIVKLFLMTDFDPNEELRLAGRVEHTMHNFRMALSTVAAPLHWDNLITDAEMYAKPIDEDPNYSMLPHSSIGSIAMRFNTWGMVYVDKTVEPPIVTYYRIDSDEPMAKRTIPTDKLSFTAQDHEKIIEENKDATVLELDKVEPYDMYRVLASGASLGPVIDEASKRIVDASRNRTTEENYLIRMATYEPMFAHMEVDKLAGARWWGVTFGALAYAVHVSSPEEACVMLEDILETGVLFGVVAQPYDEKHQAEMTERIGDTKKLQRLIPYFDLPWPDSLEEMTNEQRDAFRELGYDV